MGEASPRITCDQCVVNYLRQTGVAVESIKLGEVGVHGNGHFSFLEKNTLQVAAVVEDWIKETNRRDGKQIAGMVMNPVL